MATFPEQGEIWTMNFDPVEGHEQGGSRPALVLSPVEFNSLPSDLVIVVPVTSRARGWEFEVPIEAPEGGLTRDSVVLAHQIQTGSRSRLIDRRGQVKPPTLDAVLAISRSADKPTEKTRLAVGPEPIVIEHWEPGHARWSEFAVAMTAKDQDYFWSRADYWDWYDHSFLVGLQEDEIAGFLEFYVQSGGPDRESPVLEFHGEALEEAKILAFAVLPQYRRRGIGRTLQITAIQHARELGCFHLRSYSSNKSKHHANYQ